MGETLDHLICCTGGGGLITGISLAFERLSQQTKIWTAEPEAHDDWARSLERGEIVANAPGTRSICDAILTPEPGKLTFAIGKRLLAGGLRVSDDEVRGAMRAAFRHLKIVAEPGGAAALAAALSRMPECDERHARGRAGDGRQCRCGGFCAGDCSRLSRMPGNCRHRVAGGGA